jgi:hypothetical protein
MGFLLARWIGVFDIPCALALISGVIDGTAG